MSDVAAPAATGSSPSNSSPSTSSSPATSPSSSPSSSPVTSRQFARQLRTRPQGDFTSLSTPNDLPSNDNSLTTSQEEVNEPAPDTEDGESSPWYERYNEVHGLSAQELLESITNGQIPQALFDKLRVPMGEGEETWEGTISDLRNGALMRRQFTRKSQELAEQRRAFDAEQSELVTYLTNWKQDPQQFLFGMRRLGMPVLEAAQMLAYELSTADQMNGAVPGSGDQWLEAQQLRAEHADLLRQHQKAEEQRLAQQNEAKKSTVSKRLRNVAQEEFKSAGLALKPTHWNLFREHCGAIYQESGRLTRADIRQAVVDTKNQIEEYIKQSVAPAERPTLSGGPRLDGGRNVSTNKAAPKRPGTNQLSSRDFERQIRSGKF